MNSYSFRINAMDNGTEIQSLKEYSDFLYCLKNLKKMRKDASVDRVIIFKRVQRILGFL